MTVKNITISQESATSFPTIPGSALPPSSTFGINAAFQNAATITPTGNTPTGNTPTGNETPPLQVAPAPQPSQPAPQVQKSLAAATVVAAAKIKGGMFKSLIRSAAGVSGPAAGPRPK